MKTLEMRLNELKAEHENDVNCALKVGNDAMVEKLDARYELLVSLTKRYWDRITA